MGKRKIIIDTDPGHDDALAMILLEKSGLFDIRAITDELKKYVKKIYSH